MEDNKKFYLHGKFFEKEEDFWKEVSEWPERKITEESILHMLHFLSRDICGNVLIYRKDMKNRELQNILNEMFISFLPHLKIGYEDEK